ncbi:hypothetical protein ACSBR1_000738 [Camellia fascicularis]
MKIAVEGCMHGDLDNVYATLLHLQEVENTKIDLLICCGDFQAVRNENDLESLNVKPKYRSMNSFWKYYSGEKVAPFPTIFIGGNHEASNHLWELYYGGWVAPNIYFLGFAGVVKFGNIRIGGLSGIYKAQHYHLGHYERLPYNENDIRSIYHVREYDVHKLSQVEEPIDIFLSHDWPLGITDHGNWKELVRYKPFFKQEIQERTLGSKPAAELLEKLKPAYWFSAHLHCKFAALVQHGEGGMVTKFLALDKCLPGRRFLQIIEIESEPGPYEIQYDEEWLAITRQFDPVFPVTNRRAYFGCVHSWDVLYLTFFYNNHILIFFPSVTGVYNLTCKNVANGSAISYKQEGLNLLSLCGQYRATIPLSLFLMVPLWDIVGTLKQKLSCSF